MCKGYSCGIALAAATNGQTSMCINMELRKSAVEHPCSTFMLPEQEVERNSPAPTCGLYSATCCWRVQCETWVGSNWTSEKSDTWTSARWSRFTPQFRVMAWILDTIHWRCHFTSASFLPKPCHHQSNHEKSIWQIPVEAHSTKHLTSALQNCQEHQKQGESEQLSQPREA